MKAPFSFVVKDNKDVVIISRLVPNCYKQDNVHFYVSRGDLLALCAGGVFDKTHGKVMLVGDADTFSPDKRDEDIGMDRFISAVPKALLDVYAFLPQIEAIFFETPEVFDLTELPDASQWRDTRIHAEPHKELQAALGDLSIENWARALPPEAWEKLREGPQARALIEAAEKLMASSARVEF
jgi:hypothetical protein